MSGSDKLLQWLHSYAQPLPASNWAVPLWQSTWHSQENVLSLCKVQHDPKGQWADIDIPQECLIMKGFNEELHDFKATAAFIRPEYLEILDRIVAFMGDKHVPGDDTEMEVCLLFPTSGPRLIWCR